MSDSSHTQFTLRQKTKEEIIKERTIDNVIDEPKVVKVPGQNENVKKNTEEEKEKEAADSKIGKKDNKAAENVKNKTDESKVYKEAQKVNVTVVKSDKNNTIVPKQQEGKGNLNFMFEKIKNKTLEMGETVKNKTLQKLSQLGVFQPKHYKKMLFQQGVWPLKISVEDVGGILKDTSYLQKEEKISINYPKLLSTKLNQTVGNETITLKKLTMTNSVGFCDCEDYECFCCARVEMKKMHVNNTACTNFTFMTKSQVKYVLVLNGK